MTAAVDALLLAYPARFTTASAQAWVTARRSLLTGRAAPGDVAAAVSSGCAANGARTHALAMAQDAARALERLDAGAGTTCEACGTELPYDRLDSAPTAVRCTGCVPRSTADRRWCR